MQLYQSELKLALTSLGASSAHLPPTVTPSLSHIHSSLENSFSPLLCKVYIMHDEGHQVSGQSHVGTETITEALFGRLIPMRIEQMSCVCKSQCFPAYENHGLHLDVVIEMVKIVLFMKD